MSVFTLLHAEIGTEDALGVCEEPILSSVEINESTLGFSLRDEWDGSYLNKWHENIVATYSFQELYPVRDYVINSLGWFLVSERFRDLLVSLKIRNLVFHPLKVKCINVKGCDFTTYLCNILTSFDESVFDLERSRYSVLDVPEILAINNGRPMYTVSLYVLKSDVVSGYDVFRTTESTAVYVSERVKKAIEKVGITGCDFQEIEVV